MGNLPSWCVFLLTDLTGEETDPFCPLLSGRQTVRRTSDQPHDLRHRPFVHNSRLPRFHRRYRATAVCCKKKRALWLSAFYGAYESDCLTVCCFTILIILHGFCIWRISWCSNPWMLLLTRHLHRDSYEPPDLWVPCLHFFSSSSAKTPQKMTSQKSCLKSEHDQMFSKGQVLD